MKLQIKFFLPILGLALVPLCSYAQNAPSNQTQTMECRAMKGGDFIGPNEFLVKDSSGQYEVCHVVKATKPASQPVSATQPSNAAPQPVSALTPVTATKSTPAPAEQIESTPRSPVSRFGMAGGYEYNSANLDGYSLSRVALNGAFVEFTESITPYISVLGHVDAEYIHNVFNSGDSVVLINGGGGVQFYLMRHDKAARFSPFARSIVGVTSLNTPGNSNGFASETGLSWSLGGGIDYRPSVERRIGIRLGQVDYTKTWKQGFSINIVKVGVGISF